MSAEHPNPWDFEIGVICETLRRGTVLMHIIANTAVPFPYPGDKDDVAISDKSPDCFFTRANVAKYSILALLALVFERQFPGDVVVCDVLGEAGPDGKQDENILNHDDLLKEALSCIRSAITHMDTPRARKNPDVIDRVFEDVFKALEDDQSDFDLVAVFKKWSRPPACPSIRNGDDDERNNSEDIDIVIDTTRTWLIDASDHIGKCLNGEMRGLSIALMEGVWTAAAFLFVPNTGKEYQNWGTKSWASTERIPELRENSFVIYAPCRGGVRIRLHGHVVLPAPISTTCRSNRDNTDGYEWYDEEVEVQLCEPWWWSGDAANLLVPRMHDDSIRLLLSDGGRTGLDDTTATNASASAYSHSQGTPRNEDATADEKKQLKLYTAAAAQIDKTIPITTTTTTYGWPIRWAMLAMSADWLEPDTFNAALVIPPHRGHHIPAWPHAAGMLIFEEAGGRVTDIDGCKIDVLAELSVCWHNNKNNSNSSRSGVSSSSSSLPPPPRLTHNNGLLAFPHTLHTTAVTAVRQSLLLHDKPDLAFVSIPSELSLSSYLFTSRTLQNLALGQHSKHHAETIGRLLQERRQLLDELRAAEVSSRAEVSRFCKALWRNEGAIGAEKMRRSELGLEKLFAEARLRRAKKWERSGDCWEPAVLGEIW